MDLPVLTKDQTDRLAKLDEEIANKRAYEEQNKNRKLASSKRTGIPYDLVDSDVVRIGTLLGLVKSLDALEGRVNHERFSLLDLFLGEKEKKSRDYTKIPAYFSLAPSPISEQQRSENHRAFVSMECSKYCCFVEGMLRQELKDIDAHLCVTLSEVTVESFVEVIKENITVVLESLEREDDDELWGQLYVLRNSLIGSMNICAYKTLVNEHIAALLKMEKSKSQVLENLSFVDKNR